MFASGLVVGQSNHENHWIAGYQMLANRGWRKNRQYKVFRLTNAFSKKADMLAYSIAITFMYHNFIPAMKAGVANHKWTIEEMVDFLPELHYNTRSKRIA
jgi:hypothetical protein